MSKEELVAKIENLKEVALLLGIEECKFAYKLIKILAFFKYILSINLNRLKERLSEEFDEIHRFHSLSNK